MSTPEDDFGFVSLEEVRAQREGAVSGLSRRAERYGQRSAESIAGLPGDIYQTFRAVAQALPGGQEPEEEELNFIQNWVKSGLEALPGSEELRARSAELFPELEPESSAEETEDEIVSDFAVLALPVKGRIPFARAMGISLVANLGKQTVKAMGMGEGAQEMTKLGTMLFAGMFGKGRGINSHIKNLYQSAERFIPEGAAFRYPSKKLNAVESILKKGSMNDAKRSVMSLVEDIKAKSPNGIMTVEEAIQFDKDINREIAKSARDKTKQGLLKQLKGAHTEALDVYATENPSFGETYKEAKQAYQGIAKSVDIQNYIRSNANLKNLAHAGILLGLEESVIPGRTIEKLGALGATASTLYAAEVAKRVSTNPALRRYYANVINASLSQNKAMLARNLAGLERAAKKEFKENPLPIFDIDEVQED